MKVTRMRQFAACVDFPIVAGFVAGGFFVLRTPLLPFEVISELGSELEAAGAPEGELGAAVLRDAERIRERLRRWILQSEIREALWVASPGLEASISLWLSEPHGEQGQKIERALLRYLLRMSGRATPFGLFSGHSLGTLGTQTALALAPRGRYRRHSRLDTGYLSELADGLSHDRALRRVLRFGVNSSLGAAGGRLRYVEAYGQGEGRGFRLVLLEATDYLEATLRRASRGATLPELAAALVDDEISLEAAEAYVDELVASQVLVPWCSPKVTGSEPLDTMLSELRGTVGAEAVVECLGRVQKHVEDLDAGGLGQSPAAYSRVAEALAMLPAPVDASRLFQVDLIKPAEASLGPRVVKELAQAAQLLQKLSPAPEREELRAFREAYAERYGERAMPLFEVLDEEIGIGFGASDSAGSEASPLLRDLEFPAPPAAPRAEEPRRRARLLNLLERALRTRAKQVELSDDDVDELAVERPAELPGAFAVIASVEGVPGGDVDRGEFRVQVHRVSGPSGARLLGRFCHADPALAEAVRQHLRQEEAARPDAIFAEIVHLPEGRMGNVIVRPVLRSHEIPYLGTSGAPEGQQIPVEDLRIRIVGERVTLWSQRLGKEVIPRLTCAHNHGWRSLGIYRFLCSLQEQDCGGQLGWSWGPFANAEFLPRVVKGRVVLSPARWNLGASRLASLRGARGAEAFRAMRRIRDEVGMPRWIGIEEGDQILPLDLDNLLCVESLVQHIGPREALQLVEVPLRDGLVVQSPEGHFVNEIVVPFVREGATGSAVAALEPEARGARRTFLPGSEWLYAKLYCGTAGADELLREFVAPLAAEAVRARSADRWFFIRYGDPGWHLRVRFQGSPERLAPLRSRLEAAMAEAHARGLLWKLQLETYDREIERYGGAAAIAHAESWFHIDSEAVVSLLSELQGDARADARWRLTLLGMDGCFDALGFDLPARLALARAAREALGREFDAGTNQRKQLGERFRRERASLEALLFRAEAEEAERRGLGEVHARNEALRSVGARYLELERGRQLCRSLGEIATSLVHMHVNRMLPASARAQEFVLYDFLVRLYESKLARLRKASSRQTP